MANESLKQLIGENELVLVDFYATWCGPCKSMHPVLENLKKDMGDRIRIVKVDVDAHQELAVQHEIRSVPTLMLFRKGELVWRKSGAMPLDQLKKQIEG
ncbi:MAG: thioredoxin [Paraprevotella sp.]|nr:thioredoxin [Paraprevotella sp.]MBP3471689.1 thioredoxin [Paraprevotella sp.]